MSRHEPAVIVTRRWPAKVEAELVRRWPQARLNHRDVPLGPDGLRAALREADIVLPTVSDRLSADLFGDDVRTRFLGNFGAGYDHIDLDAARERGIVITNTPGVLTETTADLTMMLMLMVARRAGEGEREVRAGRWLGWHPTHLLGADAFGKKVGIIGMGRIGRAVARRARFGFGMPVIYHHPRQVTDLDIPDARQAGSIEEVLATADFVSLHMPGGANTHLIDGERLALMKRDAYLINTARGNVIDQQALVSALRSRSIAGAALDVYPGEPEVPEDLRRLDNIVLLPHLGSATLETRTAMGMLVLENLEAFLAEREPACRVA